MAARRRGRNVRRAGTSAAVAGQDPPRPAGPNSPAPVGAGDAPGADPLPAPGAASAIDIPAVEIPAAALAAPPAPDAAVLLAWYDRHARRLPWRIGPAERRRGVRPDPYRVWLSEVMLQQTTVETVGPYFARFLARWPTVADLAAAPEEEVMKSWAGLGYYARARNLKRCAEAVAARPGGRFPAEEAALAELPGIGAYTAAAVAAIAFDRPAAVLDGNVERVVARLFAIDAPLPGAKTEIRRRLATLVPAERPGEFAEATMDLGATICTPKRPACGLCPWQAPCAARALGIAEALPVKPAKADKPTRRGDAYVAVRTDGAVLLRRRPPSGLLGGMSEVPTGAWTSRADGFAGPPFPADWRQVPAVVEHVFTHFRLVLTVHRAEVGAAAPIEDGWWSPPAALAGEALPTVFAKVIAAALADRSDQSSA